MSGEGATKYRLKAQVTAKTFEEWTMETESARRRELTVAISEDLHRYLTFLEKRRIIKNKEDAVSTALEFYKMFAVHDWLPSLYRMGGSRVIVLDVGSLRDLFHALTDREIYTAARMAALKRKMLNPLLQGVDLSKHENWDLILKEMDMMGWGKFSRVDGEIRIEHSALPVPYLLGYLETMFGAKLKEHRTRIPELAILLAEAAKRRRASPQSTDLSKDNACKGR